MLAQLGSLAWLGFPTAVHGASATPDARETELRVGDTSARVVAYQSGDARVTYCSLHENERTSVAAARRAIDECDGRLVELRAQGQRLVSFRLDGVQYRFDPNRIFTRVGVEKTLKRYGHYSDQAREAVVAFSTRWLEVADLRGGAGVVAVHNNAPGGYSLKSYARTGAYRDQAAAIYDNPGLDPDDFFLVTEERFFLQLKERRWNAVLQAGHSAADDGSLSLYCGRAGIPYVNVEAAYSHLDRQVEMLREAHRLIAGPCPRARTSGAAPLREPTEGEVVDRYAHETCTQRLRRSRSADSA